jgi:sec-independent protein translocase protein TatB
VALIVVGPDKLPGLARSLAKGMMEIKKTLNQFKDNLTEESDQLNSVHKELRSTADELREKMIESDPAHWHPAPGHGKKPVAGEVIDVDIEPAEKTEQAAKEPPAASGKTPLSSPHPSTASDRPGKEESAP